jgi:hypothetical protein
MRSFISLPSMPPTDEMIAEQREFLASRSAAHYHGLNPSYFAAVPTVPLRRVPIAYAADPAMAAYSSYASPAMMASLPGGMQTSAVHTMGMHPQYEIEAAVMARQAMLGGQQTNPLKRTHLQEASSPSKPAASYAVNEETGEQQAPKKRRKAGRPAQDEAWNAMFMRLFRYKQENGDCLVPVRYKADPKLGAWVKINEFASIPSPKTADSGLKPLALNGLLRKSSRGRYGILCSQDFSSTEEFTKTAWSHNDTEKTPS